MSDSTEFERLHAEHRILTAHRCLCGWEGDSAITHVIDAMHSCGIGFITKFHDEIEVLGADEGEWVWDWFDDSPRGETYGVRRADEVLCYTSRTKAGYEDAVRIAAAVNGGGC